MSVRFDVSDHVARVTIDRPERLNAVDSETERRLNEIWAEIEAGEDVRCIVLTGTGERAFSAGADMKEPQSADGVAYWAQSRPNGFGGIALRNSLDVPVIARVNGFALGGGFEMVLGADIVIACEEASFGLTEARVGRLPLDGGMVMLSRLIPRNVALAEAPSYGQSILEYNEKSRGSMAYLAFAGEILRRAAKQHHYVNQ